MVFSFLSSLFYMILYFLPYIIGIIIICIILLDIKQRRIMSKNKITLSNGSISVIPYNDPMYSTLKGIKLMLSKDFAQNCMKHTMKELQKDVNGSTKLRIVQSYFIYLNSIVIWSPEVGKQVLFASDDDLGKLKSIGEFQELFVGSSILQASGDDWKNQKKCLAPAFSLNHVKSLLGEFIDIANILCEQLTNNCNNPIDIHSWMQKATLDSISRCGFGFNFHALENKPTKELIQYEEFMKEGQNPIHAIESLDKLLGTKKKLMDLFNDFEGFITQLITVKRERILKEKEVGNWEASDILDLLLEAYEDSNLSEKQILHNMNTFFVAGHETTTGAISSTLHYLAQNPQVQNKAREEILSICGNNIPTYENISSMKYIEACLKESLRLMPPAPFLIREAVRDCKIGNMNISKGSVLSIQIYSIHHDKEYWGDDVEEYIPERFLPNYKHSFTRSAYFPFSLGPRQCIGNNFALLEMKVFLAILLQNFIFNVDNNSKVKFTENIGTVLSVIPGCTLLLTPVS